MTHISDYREIVGRGTLEELYLLADRLQGKSVQNVNSTAVGGGVAEILTRMVPLLRELGVDARWDVIKGNERFFSTTKKIHNALHGVAVDITDDELAAFLETNRENASGMAFGDIMFIHDPQPIALVERRNEVGGRWVWRCHIDFSRPDDRVWRFLKSFVDRYDSAVFSAPAFARALTIPQILIAPSIDPLSDKNRELPA